jgi:hypothetical protein
MSPAGAFNFGAALNQTGRVASRLVAEIPRQRRSPDIR